MNTHKHHLDAASNARCHNQTDLSLFHPLSYPFSSSLKYMFRSPKKHKKSRFPMSKRGMIAPWLVSMYQPSVSGSQSLLELLFGRFGYCGWSFTCPCSFMTNRDDQCSFWNWIVLFKRRGEDPADLSGLSQDHTWLVMICRCQRWLVNITKVEFRDRQGVPMQWSAWMSWADVDVASNYVIVAGISWNEISNGYTTM
jgi:hypothetical protein